MNFKLNYQGFQKYRVETNFILDGIQYVFRFANNYGASVVKHSASYGHEYDLWELGVLKYDENGRRNLTYDTDITCDVERNLTDADVRYLLKMISNIRK